MTTLTQNIEIFKEKIKDKIYSTYPFADVEFRDIRHIEVVVRWHSEGKRYGCSCDVAIEHLETLKNVDIMVNHVVEKVSKEIDKTMLGE